MGRGEGGEGESGARCEVKWRSNRGVRVCAARWSPRLWEGCPWEGRGVTIPAQGLVARTICDQAESGGKRSKGLSGAEGGGGGGAGEMLVAAHTQRRAAVIRAMTSRDQ
jgi:hypothetical protein